MRRHAEGPDERDEPLDAPTEPGSGGGSLDDAADDGGAAGFDAWRRRTAVGEVGTAIARGLGAVFAPNENRPVVSAPVPGDPPDADQGFRVLLDPDDPTKAVAVFAPSADGDDGPTAQTSD